MHSSRMRTVRWSGRHGGARVSAPEVGGCLPMGVCSGGVSGMGVFAQRGVCPGVSAQGGVCQEGVWMSARGCMPRGCLAGGCLPGGV